MQILEVQVKDQAQKAVDYFNCGGNKKGGLAITHNANSYGIALKYIFAIKDLTYESVGAKMNLTAQSVNNIVNRMKRERFTSPYIEKLCRAISIDSAYFNDLVDEIDNIMEG